MITFTKPLAAGAAFLFASITPDIDAAGYSQEMSPGQNRCVFFQVNGDHTVYTNVCNIPVSAAICEDRGFHLGAFLQTGSRSCFKLQFEEMSSRRVHAGNNVTDVSITACGAGYTPSSTIGKGYCLKEF